MRASCLGYDLSASYYSLRDFLGQLHLRRARVATPRLLQAATRFRAPLPAKKLWRVRPARYVQQRASRGRRPGSHNALVSAALGRLSTRQLLRRTGSHNALADAAQPHTPIGTHSGILASSAPLQLLLPRFGAQQPLSRGLGPAEIGTKPYRKRSLCYRARAPAGPAAHSLAQRRDGQ